LTKDPLFKCVFLLFLDDFCPEKNQHHPTFGQKKNISQRAIFFLGTSRLEIIEKRTSLGGTFSKYTEKHSKKKRGSQKNDSNSPKQKNFATKVSRIVEGVSRMIFRIFRFFDPLIVFLSIFSGLKIWQI
jgi:hypothetical protein